MRREDYFKEDWLGQTGVFEERLHRKFSEHDIKLPHGFSWNYHRLRDQRDKFNKYKNPGMLFQGS